MMDHETAPSFRLEGPGNNRRPVTSQSAWERVLPAGWRPAAAALALSLMLATAILSPMAADILPDTPSQDLTFHISGIIEARQALREGQFPLRVAPGQLEGTRYPCFQFYSNLPFTAAGFLYRVFGGSPYSVFKFVLLAALTLGGFFTYRCARQLTAQHWPSLTATAVFLTAPYLLTNIHGRVALPETVAFCGLPAVLFYLQRTLAAPRVTSVLLGAISWAVIALSHNVIFFYSSFFLGIYVLLQARFTREFWLGAARAAASHALAVAMALWYMVPQLVLHKQLNVYSHFREVFDIAWLTPLSVLLAPTLVLPVPIPNDILYGSDRLGLQVSWPILAGTGYLMYRLLNAPRLAEPVRTQVRRLLICFGLAFVMAWSPVDFWKYLPSLFGCVLFSYRLLVFVVLWGALLAAHALAVMDGRMRVDRFLVCLLLLGFASAPYLTSHRSTKLVSLEQEIAHPDMGRGGGNRVFRMAPSCLAETGCSREGRVVLSAESLKSSTRYGNWTRCDLSAPGPCLVQMPVLYYPGVLDVCVDGRTVPYGNLDNLVALEVGSGTHRIAIRFTGSRWANRVSGIAWLGVLVMLLAVLSRRLRHFWTAKSKAASTRQAKTTAETAQLRQAA